MSLNLIVTNQGLLVTRDEVNNGISKVLLICCFANAFTERLFLFFLKILGEVTALFDASSASLQTSTYLSEGLRSRIEAMHAAPRTLKVHYIELLVQESVERVCPSLHTHSRAFKHLLVHVLNGVFVF